MVIDVWDGLSDAAAAQEKADASYSELHGL
jgi:hypothetical protein